MRSGAPARAGAPLRILLALAVVAAAVIAAPPAHATQTDRSVGALFFPSIAGLGPRLGLPHYCSASVVHSSSRDLVLTAAHCVLDGTGAAIEFAPGYHDGTAPYGAWAVRAIYVDHAWQAQQDPQHDVAVLRVVARGGKHIEDVVGAHRLGAAPAKGSRVAVSGYVAGSGGSPLTCTRRVGRTHGYPTVHCPGFADGTSGGPWLAGGRVVGVIGGLHQGGCAAGTSYSSRFGAAVRGLLARADRGGPGDRAPLPRGDGC